jgi:hypothetical protein
MGRDSRFSGEFDVRRNRIAFCFATLWPARVRTGRAAGLASSWIYDQGGVVQLSGTSPVIQDESRSAIPAPPFKDRSAPRHTSKLEQLGLTNAARFGEQRARRSPGAAPRRAS